MNPIVNNVNVDYAKDVNYLLEEVKKFPGWKDVTSEEVKNLLQGKAPLTYAITAEDGLIKGKIFCFSYVNEHGHIEQKKFSIDRDQWYYKNGGPHPSYSYNLDVIIAKIMHLESTQVPVALL